MNGIDKAAALLMSVGEDVAGSVGVGEAVAVSVGVAVTVMVALSAGVGVTVTVAVIPTDDVRSSPSRGEAASASTRVNSRYAPSGESVKTRPSRSPAWVSRRW